MTISPNLQRRLDRALATWPRWKAGLIAPPVVVRELPGGLNNHSFIVQTGQGRAVVRVNSASDHIFNIDRNREQLILSRIAGESFSPVVWFCDVASGVLVTEYIAGESLSTGDVGDTQTRQQIAAILARMAEINIAELPVFNYFDHLQHYRRRVLASYQVSFEQLDALEILYRQHATEIEQFQLSGWASSLVHHDLLPANIIRSGHTLKVIDWEYAANGYAAIDRMTWVSEDVPCRSLIANFSELINGYWYLLKECEMGH